MLDTSRIKYAWDHIRAHPWWGLVVFALSFIPVFSPKISASATWGAAIVAVIALGVIGGGAILRPGSRLSRTIVGAVFGVGMAVIIGFSWWSTSGIESDAQVALLENKPIPNYVLSEGSLTEPQQTETHQRAPNLVEDESAPKPTPAVPSRQTQVQRPEPSPVAETSSSAELKPVPPPAVPPVASEPAQSEPDAPLPEKEQPPAPTEAPVVAPGAVVIQETSGDNSPNIIARDVTVNPPADSNKPIITYDFYGGKHIQRGSAFSLEPGEKAVFQEMLSLYKAGNWEALAELCETELHTVPMWLTPYCCAGVAYANLGKRERAIERFEYAEKHAYGNSKYANATLNLEQLRGAEAEGAVATGP